MNLTTNSQRILHQLFTQEFRESGGIDEAHYFEFFASQQIVKDYNLSDEEIEKRLHHQKTGVDFKWRGKDGYY